MDVSEVERALATLGDDLAESGYEVGLLIIGGSSLLLLGWVDRPTADVDVAAIATDRGYEPLAELPVALRSAARRVGATLDLGDMWLDTRPAGVLELGLPPGADERIQLRRYGALTIHLLGRPDLIALKVLAAAVLTPANSKHLDDLHSLAPTDAEIEAAVAWATSQDDSPAFASPVAQALGQLRGGR